MSHAQVDVVTAGHDQTSDSGEFAIDIPGTVHVGFPIVFYVRGWLILEPFVGQRGRLPLPSPEFGPIVVKVVKPGDIKLLSDVSIRNMLSGAGHALGSSPSDPLKNSEPKTELRPAVFHPRPDFVRFHGTLFTGSSRQNPVVSVKRYYKEWIEDEAAAIGVNSGDLLNAVENWTKRAKSPFDRGLGYLFLGRANDAIAPLTTAIKTKEDVVDAYVSRASALFLLERYRDAESDMRYAVKLANALDPDLVNGLGFIVMVQRRLPEAEEIYQSALKLYHDNLGAESAITSYSNLGSIAMLRGNSEKALQYWKTSYRLATKYLDPKDRDRQIEATNLSIAYSDLKDLDHAEQVLTDEIGALRKEGALVSQRFATALQRLANVHVNNGELAAAARILPMVADIRENSQSAEDVRDTAGLLINLGRWLVDKGQPRTAEEMLLRARQLLKNHAMLTGEQGLVAAMNLSAAYLLDNNPRDTIVLLKNELEDRSYTHEYNPATWLGALSNLGEAYYSTGDYGSALKWYRDAAAFAETNSGMEDYARALRLEADSLYKLGDKHGAQELYVKAAALSKIQRLKPEDEK